MVKRNVQGGSRRGWRSGRGLAFVLMAGALSGYLLLKARSGPAVEAPAAPRPEKEPTGADDTLTPIALLSLAGERLELRAPTGPRPVLLYVFSPTCSICTANIPAWKDLFAEAETESVEVVGISVLDPVRTADYARRNDMPWKVYCVAGRESILALGIERVPYTMVLERPGRVTMAWRGEIGAQKKAEIRHRLRESVPEI